MPVVGARMYLPSIEILGTKPDSLAMLDQFQSFPGLFRKGIFIFRVIPLTMSPLNGILQIDWVPKAGWVPLKGISYASSTKGVFREYIPWK